MPVIEDPVESTATTELGPEFEAHAGWTRRKSFILAAVIGLVLLASILVWRYALRVETPVFQFARIERGRIDATVSATGTCNAVVDVQVGSQDSGNIKALYADFNTRVKAGQLVALIDPEMFEAKVKQADAALRNSKAALENSKAAAVKAEADLSSAKASVVSQLAAIAKTKVGVADSKTKLTRRQTMLKDGIIAQEDFDTAQATYDQAVADEQAAEAQHDAALHNVQSAEAALNAANKTVVMFQAEVELNEAALKQTRIDLDHTRITAPVDGTVIARHMDVGQTVAASFQAPTIFEIAQDLTKMQVDTNVAESDVGRLRVGQPATFVVDAYPGLSFQGKVTQIRQAPINVQNVITYDSVILVENPDLKLFPGMTANVTILTQRSENVLKLPNAALRFKPPEGLLEAPVPSGKPPAGNWALVYVTGQDSKLRALRVKIGITDGNFTEIQDGEIQEHQSVVVGVSFPGTSPPRTAQVPGPGRI